MNFENLKLIRIINDTVYYFDKEQGVEGQMHLYSLPETSIIWHFSMEDKEIITNAAMDDGFYTESRKQGGYTLTAYKRQNYIFFFFAIFSFSILLSLFTCIRYVNMGDIALCGSFLFFPLAFACSDIINELYGYNRVRTVIYTSTFALVIMAGLMALTLNLNNSDDATFHTLLDRIPSLMVIHAVALLLTGSLNAFVFHRFKEKMHGKALWLRALTSTFIGTCCHSLLVMSLIVLFGIMHVSVDKILELLYSGYIIKMLYALACLPLIYICVGFVQRHERRQPVKDVLS